MSGSGNTYNITATNFVNEVHDGGVGFQQNFGTLDHGAVLQHVHQAAASLRKQLDVDDGVELDNAIEEMGRSDAGEPRALLPALRSIMGIAGMAGESGKALFEAAAKAKEVLGL